MIIFWSDLPLLLLAEPLRFDAALPLREPLPLRDRVGDREPTRR